jgi:alpha-ketoglutarate-dependent taurine dioxygenase
MNEPRNAAQRPTFSEVRRKAIEVQASVRMDASAGLPLFAHSELPELDLSEWAASRTPWVEQNLTKHGAILFRNFCVNTLEQFERFTRTISPSLLEYQERSTPRLHIDKNIYTSTEYPAHLDIVQHNECSYASSWPRKIFFYCHLPAATGGETPLSDSRDVYRRLSTATRDLFSRKQVMYVRNYGLDVDLSWQEAYQTSDPAAVEAYCRGASISWEWLDNGRRLRTRQLRPAVAKHPVTGEWLWFNQAHLFHTSNLPQTARDALHATYSDQDLPRQSFLGDGSPIPPEALDEIGGVYRAAERAFPWKRGDVLLADNMLISHGRRAFTGPRRVYVAMSELWDRID